MNRVIDKIETIVEEVEDGIRKLNENEIWTANSHSISMFIVSIFLLFLAIGAFLLELYFFVKFKIVWRLRSHRS